MFGFATSLCCIVHERQKETRIFFWFAFKHGVQGSRGSERQTLLIRDEKVNPWPVYPGLSCVGLAFVALQMGNRQPG